MSSRLLLFAGLFVPLLAGRSAAAPQQSSLCPALFGNAEQQQRNRQARTHALHWLHPERAGVTVAHSHASWRTPVPLQLAGLRLAATAAGEGAAILELSPELAATLGCRAGRYRVGADAALGKEARALAVLEGVLLLEHERRLAYLLTPGATPPRWLMAWRVRGIVGKLGSAGRSPAPAPRPRPPPPRPRPPGRR